MPDLFNITDEDKRACAKREIEMRMKVYPRWIESGRISKEKAEWEMAVMMAIEDDYYQKTKR